jgi:hypothetical protein
MTTRFYQILKDISSENENFQFSDKHKGAGYHSVQGGLHTVVYELENFIGSIVLQGTLMEKPGDNDWVNVVGTGVSDEDSTPVTDNINKGFSGNFVWIRAKYQLIDGKIVNLFYNY